MLFCEVFYIVVKFSFKFKSAHAFPQFSLVKKMSSINHGCSLELKIIFSTLNFPSLILPQYTIMQSKHVTPEHVLHLNHSYFPLP